MPSEKDVTDGEDNFLGGQDASKRPDNVRRNSYYAAINVTTEEGSLSPRWGFRRRTLDWSNAIKFRLPNLQYKTYQEVFETGRFQALIPYSIGNTYYLIIIVSGIIFLINQKTFLVAIMKVQDGGNLNENTPRIASCEAGKYLIIFDYPNLPVIVSGNTARRSNRAKHEVPVARLGNYNTNRLFIVNGGNQLTAGDPAGLRGVTNANPPISFLEIEQEGSDFKGQVFDVSTNYNNDKIIALAFLQVADTSTGIGPLLLATKKAIWSYMVQNPRAGWEQGQFGSILLYNAGIVGSRGIINISSDVFFVSDDAEMRALSMSRDEQSKWSKTPMSREIKNWLKQWYPDLKKYVVLGYFRNKIFLTVNPYCARASSIIGKPITDYAHGGMAVLELDNISNMKGDSSPVWAGLWTGVRPMDMANSNEQFFVVSKDDDSRNYIYEMTPDSTYDVVDDKIRYIRSRLYTRDYDFQQPMNYKKLKAIYMSLEQLAGTVHVSIEYKASHGAVFVPWREKWIHKAPWNTYAVPTPPILNGFSGHSFKHLNFGSPEDSESFDPVSEDTFEECRRVRLKIDITGKYWQLNKLILTGTIDVQSATQIVVESDQYREIELPVEIHDDWAITSEDILCQTI